MQTNDKYRRDSLDGGINWGTPYQFKGEDGNDGSDASVPGYIKNTYIDASNIESFHIRANKMEAVCPAVTPQTAAEKYGFMLTKQDNDYSNCYLHIYAYYPPGGLSYPETVFTSGDFGSYARWDFPICRFNGKVFFNEDVTFKGSVTGITATFG